MEIKTPGDFKMSLQNDSPSTTLSVYAKALWWAAKGNWDRAHNLIQDVNDRKASRIHAYLHRLEGDISNANYWYSKAGTTKPDHNLEKEWENLVKEHV
jgi:hypothetical protein